MKALAALIVALVVSSVFPSASAAEPSGKDSISDQCVSFAWLVLVGQRRAALGDTPQQFRAKVIKFERLYVGPTSGRALAVLALLRGYKTPPEADQEIIAQKAYDDCVAAYEKSQ